MRIMLLALICACLLPGSAYAKPEKFVEGRIIVLPRAGLPEADFKKTINEHRGRARKIGQSDLYIVDVPHGSERGIVARLEHNPHFKFAELDYIVSPDFVPNDPQYLSAWHLPKIHAAEAWDTAQGAGVTIAILDSGVDPAHPDLASRLVPGWNFYDNNSLTVDVYGHGTKVAGSAAAITNNAVGVSGVAGQAKIMPIRVAGTDGRGTYSAITSGIVYAADHGARVTSASFAYLAGSSAVINASQYLKGKGGLSVVSAGNFGTDLGYAPSSSLIAVSATDGNDVRASWSSYGVAVDVAAPGVSILTTTMGGGYGSVSGTSFSSPITAGVIALVMSANPNLSSADIEKALFSTAVDLGGMGYDPYYGWGRINAAAAVEAVRLATPSLDLELPLVDISSPLEGATVSGLVPVNVTASDNVGVSRVELRVNGSVVALDTASPFAFSWNSAGTVNGVAKLIAVAYDAAGNVGSSDPVSVNVANGTTTVLKDTTPPVVKITNPVPGNVAGNVTITVNASDNNGAAGIKLYLYIDGVSVASGTGSTLSYNWNSRKNSYPGLHAIQVTARDAAGNSATATVNVTVTK